MSKRLDGRIAPTLLNNWVEERAAFDLAQQQQRQKEAQQQQQQQAAQSGEAQYSLSGKRLEAADIAALTPAQQQQLKRQALERQLWEQAV